MPLNKKLGNFFFILIGYVSLTLRAVTQNAPGVCFFLAVKLFLYLELLYFNIASINASNYLERYRDSFLRLVFRCEVFENAQLTFH